MNIFIIKGDREICFFSKKCHSIAIAPCINLLCQLKEIIIIGLMVYILEVDSNKSCS